MKYSLGCICRDAGNINSNKTDIKKITFKCELFLKDPWKIKEKSLELLQIIFKKVIFFKACSPGLIRNICGQITVFTVIPVSQTFKKNEAGTFYDTTFFHFLPIKGS